MSSPPLAASAPADADGPSRPPSFVAIWTPDWSKFDPRFGLRVSIAIGLCLAIGYVVGSPGYGALAASGALAAGFGAFERIRGSSVIPMLGGTIGCAVACFAGHLIGHGDAAFVALGATVGLMCGLSISLGTSYWYLSLQLAITALVAAEYLQADLRTVSQRAALMLAGGLTQTVSVALLRRFKPLRSPLAPPDRLDVAGTTRVILNVPTVLRATGRRLQRSRRHWLSWRSPVVREAMRVAAAAATAAGLSRLLALEHGYWGPMTTLIVMKSDLHLTIGRGLARVTGTLAGVALSASILAIWHPPPSVVLCALAWLFAVGCFSIVKANYAIYSICITGFVVSELAFLGETHLHTALSRGFATMMGFAIAVLIHLPWNVHRLRGRAKTSGG